MERTMRLPLANKQYVIISAASDFAAGFVLLIEDYTKEPSKDQEDLCTNCIWKSKVLHSAIQAYYSHKRISRNFLRF